MNQWSFQNRSPLIHDGDPYSSPYKAAINGHNSLMHYGVKGQQWGVITKEYEPVAVDHRKLRSSQNTIHTTVRRKTTPNQLSRKQKREILRRERQGYYTKENGRTVWHQNGRSYSPSEERQKIMQRAIIGAGAAAALIAIFGGIHMARVRKAKAYSGILSRFISQNPIAKQNSDAGRKLLKRGMELAKQSSSSRKSIKVTNDYLRKKGLELSGRDALRMYKGRKDLSKQLKYAFDRKKVLTYLRKFGKL